LAVLVEIHQGEPGAQPVVILPDVSISGLVEAEDAHQNSEGMLHFGSDPQLGRVLAFGFFVHMVLENGTAAGQVMSCACGAALRMVSP